MQEILQSALQMQDFRHSVLDVDPLYYAKLELKEAENVERENDKRGNEGADEHGEKLWRPTSQD